MTPKTTAPAEKHQADVETDESILTDITGVCVIRTNCAGGGLHETQCDRPDRCTHMLRAMERTSVTCMTILVNARVRAK